MLCATWFWLVHESFKGTARYSAWARSKCVFGVNSALPDQETLACTQLTHR